MLARRVQRPRPVNLNTWLRAVLAGVAAAALSTVAACTSTDTSMVSPGTDKCQVTATASPAQFGADGGSGTVTVSAARDCQWSIATDAGWVSVPGAHEGQGDASLAYTVAPNP